MAARRARRSSILKSRNSVGPGGDGGSEEIYSSEGTDGGANTTRNLAALLRKRVSFSQTNQVKEFEKTSSFASDGSNSGSGTAIDMNQTVVDADMDMSLYVYENEEEIENVHTPSAGLRDYTRVDHHEMSVVEGANGDINVASVGGNRSRQGRSKDQTLCFPNDMSVTISNDKLHDSALAKSENSRYKMNHTTMFSAEMSIVQSPDEDNGNIIAAGDKSKGGRRKDQTLCFPNDKQPDPALEKSGNSRKKMNHTTMYPADMSIVQSPNEATGNAIAAGDKLMGGRKKDQTLCFPNDMSLIISNDKQHDPPQVKSGNSRHKMNHTTMFSAEMSIVQSPDEDNGNAIASGGESIQDGRKDKTLCIPTDMSVLISNDRQHDPAREKSGNSRKKMNHTTMYPADMSIVQSPNEDNVNSIAGGGKSNQGRRKDQTLYFPTNFSVGTSRHPNIPNDIDGPAHSRGKSGTARHKMNRTKVFPAEMSIFESPTENHGNAIVGGGKSIQTQRKDQTLCFPTVMSDMSLIDPNDKQLDPAREKSGNASRKMNRTKVFSAEMSIFESPTEDNGNALVGGEKSILTQRKDQTLCFQTDMSVINPNDIEHDPVGEMTSRDTRQKMNHTAMYPADMSIFNSANGDNGSPSVGGKKPRQGRIKEQTLYFSNDMSVFVPNDDVGIVGEKYENSRQKIGHTAVYSESPNTDNGNVGGGKSIQGQSRDQICSPIDMSVFTPNLNNIGREKGGNTGQPHEDIVEKPTAMTTAGPVPRPVFRFEKPDPKSYRNPFGANKNRRKIKLNSNSNQDMSTGKLSFGVFANPKTPKRNVLQFPAKIALTKTTMEKALTVNEHVQTSPALMMNLPKAMCNVSINCTIANHTDEESTTSFGAAEKMCENAIKDCENSVVEHENGVVAHGNDVDDQGNDLEDKADGHHVNDIDNLENDLDDHEDDPKSENNDQHQQQLDSEYEEDDVAAAMETCRSTASRKELDQFPEEDWDLEKPECLALSTIENKFHGTIQPDQLLDIQNLTICDATGVIIDNGQDEDELNSEMDEESELDEKKEDESEIKDAEPIEFVKKADNVEVLKNTKQNCVMQSGGIEDDESSDVSEVEVEPLLNQTKAKGASGPEPKKKTRQKQNNSIVSDISSKIKTFIQKNSDDPWDKYTFISSIEIDLAKLPEEQWNWISSKHNDFFEHQIIEAILRLRRIYLDCLGSRIHRLAIGSKFGLSSK
ncbi:unnamed protein product [Orchesella dallaii]|uniref:Uncharacterized protein n=1 Tax=Orchesella dallaii TaxID=48710 RepID=A0ABP1RDY6_9HEXA